VTPETEKPAEAVSGWHQQLDEMMAGLEVEEDPVESEALLIEQASTEVAGEVEMDLTAFEARIGQEKAENFIMPDRHVINLWSTNES